MGCPSDQKLTNKEQQICTQNCTNSGLREHLWSVLHTSIAICYHHILEMCEVVSVILISQDNGNEAVSSQAVWGQSVSKVRAQVQITTTTISSDRWFRTNLAFDSCLLWGTSYPLASASHLYYISFHELICLQYNATGLHKLVSTWNCLSTWFFNLQLDNC